MILQEIIQRLDLLSSLSDDIHEGVYVYNNLYQFDLTFKEITKLLDEDPSLRLRLKLVDATAYAYLDHAEVLNSSFAKWPKDLWGHR